MRAWMLLLLVCLVADAGPSGTIRGRVHVYEHGKLVKKPEYVYVYAQPQVRARHAPLPGAGVSAKIVQNNTMFDPHVVIVPVGAKVYFPNLETQEHNVFSPTDPPGAWDLGRYGYDRVGRWHQFDVPAEVDIFCDIHREMWAKVKVIPSAYFVATASDGTFTLTGLPPGKYKVVAWMPNISDEEVKSEVVTVTDGATVTLEHDLNLQQTPPRGHMRKDGTPYPCPPGYPDCM